MALWRVDARELLYGCGGHGCNIPRRSILIRHIWRLAAARHVMAASGQTVPRKPAWHDSDGNRLTAGGILVYDEKGVWAIMEDREDYLCEWSDIGGRYRPEDGDIWFTIAREFCEETYHMAAMTRNSVLHLTTQEGVATCFLLDRRLEKPVYLSLVVPADRLAEVGVVMSPDAFLSGRERVLGSNPEAPPGSYPALELRHITYEALRAGTHRLSSRLVSVLAAPILSRRIGSRP